MGADREEAEKIRKTFIKHYPRVKIEYKHASSMYNYERCQRLDHGRLSEEFARMI